ncbi:MAG: hypothetical protein U0T69_02005 [Chitinophagales bacterium]
MFLKIKRIISLFLSNFVIFCIIPYKKKCFITCAGKTDGLGAQVQAIYSAQLYCLLNNIVYCHTPLNNIAHNYDNNSAFNQEAEHFFSFSLGEKGIDEFDSSYKIINLDNFTSQTFIQIFLYLFSSNPKVIFSKSHYHNYINKYSTKYSLIKKKLQDKFYKHPKKETIKYNDKCLHLACHIRRGDVDSNDEVRYTDNEIIFNKLSELLIAFKQLGINSQINIFSQGKIEDFGKLGDIATLYLNGNVFNDFYNLVKADVFIMAKSSFSYSAALLSDGVIIYEPFWHPPLNEWFISQKEFFKSEAFLKRVSSIYSTK